MRSVGNHTVTYLYMPYVGPSLRNNSDVAVSEWNRLCQLGPNCIYRRHKTVSLDFLQHHLYLLWLLARLIKVRASAKFDKHPFRACGNQ